MIRLLFALLYLSHFVQGTNIITTNSTCMAELPDGSYRSTWSILGSCAVTLVICIWHAVHLDVPKPGEELVKTIGNHAYYAIFAFSAQDWLIWIAVDEWMRARQRVVEFRERGYEWSMTHSFFAAAGGFVYRNKEGHLKVINALEFLDLCEAGKIVHPLITVKDIQDRSKSDAVSKAIFIIQLLWFMLQISVRHFTGFAVTLVELDTLCMSFLAVFYILLWWNKPLNAGSPHVFDETQEDKVYSPEELSKAWKSQPRFLYRLGMSIVRVCAIKQEEGLGIWRVLAAIRLPRSMYIEVDTASLAASAEQATTRRKDTNRSFFLRTPAPMKAIFKNTIEKVNDPDTGSRIALVVAWNVLGAMHLAAWNDESLSLTGNQPLWRGASLALVATGPVAFIGVLFYTKTRLVFLFACLYALPCTAHRIILWVQYIPHL